MPPITNDWKEPLKPELSKAYYRELYKKIMKEYQGNIPIYPPSQDIFNAFHLTPLSQVKCVILGQDPYHEPGQAHGLCFSVKPEVTIPPSLQNIFIELHNDLGCPIPNHGYLVKWAQQGVLMLNTVLTVRAHQANSHKGIGWEQYTDAVMRILDQQNRPIAFLLWGAPARKKAAILHNPNHLLLTSAHPSPLSADRGFFGSRPFSKVNNYLVSHGVTPIDWEIQ